MTVVIIFITMFYGPNPSPQSVDTQISSYFLFETPWVHPGAFLTSASTGNHLTSSNEHFASLFKPILIVVSIKKNCWRLTICF